MSKSYKANSEQQDNCKQSGKTKQKQMKQLRQAKRMLRGMEE